MGLFDFLKNVGKKLPKDADVAAELQKSVSAMGLDIQDLHVAFEKGTATLRGAAATQKDLELARLVVGNHEGVEKVNDDGLTVVPRAAAVQPAPAAGPTAAAPAGIAAQSSQVAAASVGMGAAAAAPAAGRMYTVKSGDTLSRIAKETLGDPGKYPALFEANKPMIKDPDEIYPGQVLRIPPMGEVRPGA